MCDFSPANVNIRLAWCTSKCLSNILFLTPANISIPQNISVFVDTTVMVRCTEYNQIPTCLVVCQLSPANVNIHAMSLGASKYLPKSFLLPAEMTFTRAYLPFDYTE
ncbi:hypothetical protein AVEN_17840-1 [Araneus ventricosus]|uniref:Uncharacterized protein n=1 Tax=Araneus ventricosus TaxID=182803 RepID=A0A4Y2QN88_ARAVE|nr:hypothetical protein AVEN_17840-1 [Araneus ventricosus]